MNNKEILAAFKISYEYLQDIVDNADNEQMDDTQKAEIKKIMNKLADLYEDTFENKHTTNISTKYDKLILADNIHFDYYDIEEEIHLTNADIGYTWYYDYDFLTD